MAPEFLTGIKLQKNILILILALPFIGLVISNIQNPPADPYSRIAHTTGEFALRFLVLTLMITPLKQAFGWKRIGAFRRILGVAAFTYALLHFFAYVSLEASFDFSYFIEDIKERRYILFGSAAFLLMLPLAITSNNISVRKLGGKAWKKLHTLVFPIAIFASLHFFILKRGNKTEPLIYLGIFLVLFAWRIVASIIKKRKAASATATAA